LKSVRFQEPSAGCLLPGLLLGGDAVVGAVIAIGLLESPPMWAARLIAPVYAAAAYWMLTLCNRRTVVVEPAGVRIRFGPVPNVSGRWIPRSEITSIYARDTVASFDEGDVPDGTWFAIGLETRDGREIDLYSRGADASTALAAAREISQVFNANPGEPPIEVRLATASRKGSTIEREFVFWAAVGLAAIALGAVWALRQ
jgi:hypothetical protein